MANVRILMLAFVLMMLASSSASAARLNPDGTTDPSGCGGFSTSRGDRIVLRLQYVFPPLAIATFAAATAWFAMAEMNDAKGAASRQRWGITVGISMAAAVASCLLGAGLMFFV